MKWPRGARRKQACASPGFVLPASLPAPPPRLGREAEPGASGEVICPKCRRPRRLVFNRKGGWTNVLVLHGQQKCYLGPERRVRGEWPYLLERGQVESTRTG